MHRVVVIGGGAGGLVLATHLGRKLGRPRKAEVILIDAGRTHIWKPLLHQVAAGSFDPGVHSVEYLEQARRNHFRFRMGRLESIDRDQKSVWLSPTLNDDGVEIIPRRRFSYDTLVLAIGSVSHDFGVPGVRENCWFLDSKQEAVNFQKRLMERLIQAATHTDPLAPGHLDVAIVGAGATGVELAAQLHQVTRKLREYGFDQIDPEHHVRINVLDAGPRILPALPQRIAEAVEAQLQDLGVRVMAGRAVTAVTPEGVSMGADDFLPAAITVWAAGIKAPDVTRSLDIETNKINQVVVDHHLRSISDPNVFAIGDCAAFPVDEQGQPVPPRAQAAHQQASYVAREIVRQLNGKSPGRGYVYRDYGSLVTLGRYSTVGSLMGSLTGNVWISGLIARLVYLSLHKMHQVTVHGPFNTLLLTLSSVLRRSVNPELKLH